MFDWLGVVLGTAALSLSLLNSWWLNYRVGKPLRRLWKPSKPDDSPLGFEGVRYRRLHDID